MNKHEQDIIDRWRVNAKPWTEAIESAAISSRETVTNAAVIAAVLRHRPRRVLDVGCGEGWLMRQLAGHGISVTGLDAVPELVERAKQQGSKDCYCLCYGELGEVEWPHLFDLAVCNFSLLGEDIVAPLRAVRSSLAPSGRLIVQTLHPCFIGLDGGYRSAWQEGSWQGLPAPLRDGFNGAPPWYFRRLCDWLDAFSAAGFQLQGLSEPGPEGSPPLSLIFDLSC